MVTSSPTLFLNKSSGSIFVILCNLEAGKLINALMYLRICVWREDKVEKKCFAELGRDESLMTALIHFTGCLGIMLPGGGCCVHKEKEKRGGRRGGGMVEVLIPESVL